MIYIAPKSTYESRQITTPEPIRGGTSEKKIVYNTQTQMQMLQSTVLEANVEVNGRSQIARHHLSKTRFLQF